MSTTGSAGAPKEQLISSDELSEAANRQGYASLGEAKQAVLNPAGSFAVVRKKGHTESHACKEILDRIQYLAGQIGRLQPGEGLAGR
jgi:hypothetical protein